MMRKKAIELPEKVKKEEVPSVPALVVIPDKAPVVSGNFE
jgi:hypothetical protein